MIGGQSRGETGEGESGERRKEGEEGRRPRRDNRAPGTSPEGLHRSENTSALRAGAGTGDGPGPGTGYRRRRGSKATPKVGRAEGG